MTIFVRIAALCLALMAPLVSFGPAAMAKVESIVLNAEQTAAIQRVNDYINSFQSLRGDFTQVSSSGTTMQGVVMISKPGKMRFEYAPPNPLLIIADGKWLTIKNKVKERGDQFPLSATPLRLVVARNVDLMAETNVIGFEQSEGLTSVSMQDRKSKLGGYITLIFDETTQQLQQWIVVDGKGRQTSVALANIETGVTFDPKLFIGKINRDVGKN
jgi:outer membrane lipoprotein-sorting protein